MRLFLDDERHPVGEGWIVVRSVAEAVSWVESHGFPDFVSFDNDLGQGKEEGWRFAQWLIERDLDTCQMPQSFDFFVHSQNSVRREDIELRLRRYMEYRKAV